MALWQHSRLLSFGIVGSNVSSASGVDGDSLGVGGSVVSGPDAAAFHLVNVLLHCAVTLLFATFLSQSRRELGITKR